MCLIRADELLEFYQRSITDEMLNVMEAMSDGDQFLFVVCFEATISE